KLGISGLEIFDNLRPGPAQYFQLDFAEALPQLVDMRQDEAEFDAAGDRELERADLTVVDHCGERAGALGAVVTLLEQRKHPLAEWREHDTRPFAPEKIAAQLALKEFDGPCQRRLGNVALFRRAGEIQRPCNRQEVSYLVHFHTDVPNGGH